MNWQELEVVSKTIKGEAGGELWIGKVAVACVIRNRVRKGGWWGNTWVGVCLKEWQFSCWNPGTESQRELQELSSISISESYKECIEAGLYVMDRKSVDVTGGATHYYADYIKEPYWAKGKEPVMVVGVHRFYKGIA